MTENDKNVYIIEKLLMTIIFDSNNVNYQDKTWSHDIKILEVFKELIAAYVERKILSKELKYNINNFLIQIRMIKDEDSEKRIKIINDIILLLNGQDKDKSLTVYINELWKRRSFKYLFYSDEVIKNEIPAVNESICFDTQVLISHDKTHTSDADFIKHIPILKDNLYYYESLRAILSECPSMFKDDTFYRRILYVLDLNYELYNELKEENKKMIKKINKYR